MGSSSGAAALGLMLVALVVVLMAVGVIVAVVLGVSYLLQACWRWAKKQATKINLAFVVITTIGSGAMVYQAASSPAHGLALWRFWLGITLGVVGVVLLLISLPSTNLNPLSRWQRLKVDGTFWLLAHRNPILLGGGFLSVLAAAWIAFPTYRDVYAAASLLSAGFLVGVHRETLAWWGRSMPTMITASYQGLKRRSTVPVKPAEPVIEALARTAECENACISGYIGGDPNERCTSNLCLWADLVWSRDIRPGT